jgi:hypothetical protein
MKFLALLLLACAAVAHAQHGRFDFATRDEARAVLGQQDEYVRATAPLERTLVLRDPASVDAERFAAAMADQARDWTNEERAALAPVLARLEPFIAAQKWREPHRILMVKADRHLMNGFPHTRSNAIILPDQALQEAMQVPRLLDYLLSHESFHVLSRANPVLREDLYRAIGFHACASVALPADLAPLRLTNPDAPVSRHAIAARRGAQSIEVVPFVHLSSAQVDPAAGVMTQLRTAWLPVERHGERCSARGERLELDDLAGVYEQVGRNTAYLIHPEEILADNFAYLFRPPPKLASPEIPERMRRILQ